jgi:hypothetical protein
MSSGKKNTSFFKPLVPPVRRAIQEIEGPAISAFSKA